ncbi:LysE/ArgO family amino acid transporter [Streptomyces tauricus]|uniref:LysE/ArgO family amino acid transporter n=1 Tax=Streptomyces tauricus TaxID=68274 RepID=UPI0022445D0D|nr:LysE family transporter [Streptomyces tauricus]MCW8096390.1 LysE family transporter [Streptomyces tauricus]
MNSALTAAAAGFGTGLSLIVAIGAQNAFVLRQGVRRDAVLAVVAICALSDAALIALGVGGVGAVVVAWPAVLTAVGLIGGLFLIGYGCLAARRVLKPSALTVEPGAAGATGSAVPAGSAVSVGAPGSAGSAGVPSVAGVVGAAGAPGVPGPSGVAGVAGRAGSRRRAVLTCLAMTWLNPHVYLDTVFLLGSIAADRGPWRWTFGLGAMLASLVWFAALGFGARLLSPLLARPSAWRVLDALIAVTMIVLGATLIAGV